MGITGVSLNNGSQFTGLQYSTVANATLIAAMTPAVTSLLAFVFLRERLALLQWIGIIISISGTLYLISNGNLDIILHISFNLGDILFFVAQLSWAIYCLISIRVMKKCLYYLLQHGQEYLGRFLLQSMVILLVVYLYQIYL